MLECGVAVPDDFTRSSGCQVANGVGWYVPDSQIDDQSADVVMSTAGYRPVLQVSIPASYRPNGVAAAMVELGAGRAEVHEARAGLPVSAASQRSPVPRRSASWISRSTSAG